MQIYTHFDSPLSPTISFKKIIEEWESRLAQYPNDEFLKDLVERTHAIPELKTGFKDFSIIEKNESLIADLLSLVFPKLLSKTTLSAASFPWSNRFFNATELFQKTIATSGKDFCINNNDFDENSLYIAICSIILNQHYEVPISSYFPLHFNFKDQNGINKHFRIVYNADFLHIYPSEKAVQLTRKDIDYLLDHPNDIEIWKAFFPSKSWNIEGFGIMSMIDTTVETAFSNLKQRLSTTTLLHEKIQMPDNENLKSIFNIPSIQVGVSSYDFETDKITAFNSLSHSLLTNNASYKKQGFSLISSAFIELVHANKPFIISNFAHYLERFPQDEIALHLQKSGYKSCALIPLKKNDRFIGIAELASEIPSAFNSLTSYKINMIYGFLSDRLEAGVHEFSNLKNSTIQKEYTRLHESVAWKFDREVENYLKNPNEEYHFKEIVFKDVVALYGEVDIRNSSKTQNNCIKKDLKRQMEMLEAALDELYQKTKMELIQQKTFELHQKQEILSKGFKSNIELSIQNFISNEIHPILSNPDIYEGEAGSVANYLKSLDENNGLFYHERKKFDESIQTINQTLIQTIDERQKEIQLVFPHYFERFKTDGIDHTIYIGHSISPQKNYDEIYLQNLRLWQLQVTCEMLRTHHFLNNDLPIPMDLTALILVFDQPISIRFRMDEKRFDVDGSYNAQYEVLKKRIDKSHIKGTSERLTAANKIAIVYSNSAEEKEYLSYIRFFQNKKQLKNNIEFLELENLQGVTGLKALRVAINWDDLPSNNLNLNYFTANDFQSEMN
ncbi:MAG TPA: hypothetical protein VL022_05110 [Moheibacter sp.]|nr:hypothetical protein [Moheibacter sp.]